MNRPQAIFAILGLAFILRIWGLGFGLPYLYHQDEPIVVNHAMAIGAEGWNTRTYLPPQFSSYFLFIFYAGYFVLGRLSGLFSSADDFAIAFLRDPSWFYLLGRLALGVLFGTANVALAYRVGKKFFSERTAFFSALFLAIAFIHVQHSHYIYMDIALSYAVTLLFYYGLKGIRKPGFKNALKEGVAFGWAVSVKYTAIYFFPAVLAGFWAGRARGLPQTFKKCLGFGIISVLTYAVISPFSFIDWPNFISQVRDQSAARGFSGPLHHLLYSLIPGTGILFMCLAAFGAFSMTRRFKREAILLLSGVVIYYGVNIYFSQAFARYMMPLVPLFCLLAAFGAETLLGNRRRRFVAALVLIAVMLEMLAPTLYSDRLFCTQDTRTLCREWFLKYVPAGTAVAVDNRFFGPHLDQTPQWLKDKKWALGAGAPGTAKSKRLDLQIIADRGKPTYEVYALSENADEKTPSFLFLKPFLRPDLAELKKHHVQYLVINYSDVNEEFHRFKEAISDHVELEAVFSPFKDPAKRRVADPEASTAAPHLFSDLWSRSRLGPYLEVYRLKGE